MLLLGHTGITLGLAILGKRVAGLRDLPKTERGTALNSEGVSAKEVAPGKSDQALSSPVVVNQISSMRKQLVNYGFILLGSMLPDIIDKPLGLVFFRDVFSNSRIFAHTLLFLIVIALAGLLLYRYRKQYWLLLIAFGTLCHLLLDAMWWNPVTLYWPLLGVTFEKLDLTTWAENILRGLFTNPAVYIPELIGAVILVTGGSRLVQKVRSFHVDPQSQR